MTNSNKLEQVKNLCIRRGFIFPSSEIYGGLNGIYDYGPYGTMLKNNIKREWKKAMLRDRDDIVALDASILMNSKVWEASGHTGAGFTDPLRECKKCRQRFKADEITSDKCPNCAGELLPERQFNILVKTHLGPVEDQSTLTYLRGETAQGIFVNYKLVMDATRQKIPFGIAQIGKAFRNEINPRNFIFRMREFEQMEMEYFVKPDRASDDFQSWKERRLDWYLSLGINEGQVVLHEKAKADLAHYAKAAADIEFEFPWGFGELEGIHNRGDFDLAQHQKFSGKDLQYFDEESRQKYLPHIIETSAGVERSMLAFLISAYEEIEGGRSDDKNAGGNGQEVVLRLHPKLAPIKAAIFPLVKKEGLPELAKKIYHDLKKEFPVEYDESGSIGRRYRRQDEIGTPYCITVDFDSLKDQNVTIRDRDTMKQERVGISELANKIKGKLQ